MDAVQTTAARQWDAILGELREVVPRVIEQLQDLEAAAEACFGSCEMGPEEWSEQSADLEHFVTRDKATGDSPEDTAGHVFELIRDALEAGDSLVNFESF